MTTPNGNPPWVRGTTAPDYGGKATLRNYGGIGAVNASTDITAEQYLRLCADIATLIRVSPICSMVIEHTSGGDWYVNYCKPMWADELTVPYEGSARPSLSYPELVEVTSTSVAVGFESTQTGGDFAESGTITIRNVIPFGTGATWAYAGSNLFVVDGLAAGADPCPLLVF